MSSLERSLYKKGSDANYNKILRSYTMLNTHTHSLTCKQTCNHSANYKKKAKQANIKCIYNIPYHTTIWCIPKHHTKTPHHTTPPNPTPPHPTQPHATPRHATPRHATPRHATPRHATPRHATPHHSQICKHNAALKGDRRPAERVLIADKSAVNDVSWHH